MSSNWYQKWEDKERKLLARETYEDLLIHASRSLSFIEGQLQYGIYDSEDLFGECGHVTHLYLTQEVIYQKAQELGISNPQNFFFESRELQDRGFMGPKLEATLSVFQETCKEAEEEMAKEADDYSPEGEWFDK
tara:strand:+ start:653 stop:1054 length:402 start_codon:yes stop_codon:yes gene_type:complete